MFAAAQLGAEWAWTALYRDLVPSVRGYVRARGAAEPDDVVGEVFLQVVRDLGRFDGGEREFRTWLFTIAHHRLLDARRRAVRRRSNWRQAASSRTPATSVTSRTTDRRSHRGPRP